MSARRDRERRNEWLVGSYRQAATAWRKSANELHRLSGLTDDSEVRKILLEQANLAERHATRRDEWAIQAEYGHLYEDEYLSRIQL